MQSRLLYILTASFFLMASCHNDKKKEIVNNPEINVSVQHEFIRLMTQGDSLLQQKDSASIRYYSKAVLFSEKNNYEAGYADANLAMGAAYTSLNKLDDALPAINNAIGSYAALHDSLQLLNAYYCLSDALIRKGALTLLLSEKNTLDTLVSKYRKTEPLLVMKICNNIANAYADMGQRDSAADYYNAIINMGDTLNVNNAELVAGAHNGLASLYVESALFDKALEQLDITNAILKKYRNNTLEILSKTNRALTYYQSGKPEAALPYIKEAYQLAEDSNLDYYMPSIANLLVATLVKQGDYEAALPYSLRSYTQATASGNANGIITASYSLAHNYIALKRYKEAIPVAENALNLSVETGRYADISNAYEYLAESYEGLGNYPRAYHYMKEYAFVQDSLRSEKNTHALVTAEKKYQQEKGQKTLLQNKLLLTQKDNLLKRKNLWITVISLASLFALVLLFTTVRNIKAKNKLQQKELHLMERDKELEIVKAKLHGIEDERNRISKDLHDGVVVQFSAVKMNLSMLSEKHNTLQNAPDYMQVIKRLDEATAELRKTAHNLMPGTLLQSGLSEAVYYFCKNMEQSAAININMQHFDEVPRLIPEIELSIFRVIQETLQNILKHSFAKSVLLQMSCNDNLLNITIEDDGIEWNYKELINSRKGTGLRNIQERIRNMKGSWDVSSSKTSGNSIYMELDILNYLLPASNN